MGDLLPLNAVAARLGVSRATLYRILARGEGPTCRRIGKRQRVAAADLENWLESCREVRAA